MSTLTWGLVRQQVTSCIVGLPRGAGGAGSAGAHRSQEQLGGASIRLDDEELSTIEAVRISVVASEDTRLRIAHLAARCGRP